MSFYRSTVTFRVIWFSRVSRVRVRASVSVRIRVRFSFCMRVGIRLDVERVKLYVGFPTCKAMVPCQNKIMLKNFSVLF